VLSAQGFQTIRADFLDWAQQPALLDVNYPDRSATTILAGGSGG
jgi:hypothetical protein